MRNYTRVYHTSMDYLARMGIQALLDELHDAIEELREEQEEAERKRKQIEDRARRGRR